MKDKDGSPRHTLCDKGRGVAVWERNKEIREYFENDPVNSTNVDPSKNVGTV